MIFIKLKKYDKHFFAIIKNWQSYTKKQYEKKHFSPYNIKKKCIFAASKVRGVAQLA